MLVKAYYPSPSKRGKTKVREDRELYAVYAYDLRITV